MEIRRRERKWDTRILEVDRLRTYSWDGTVLYRWYFLSKEIDVVKTRLKYCEQRLISLYMAWGGEIGSQECLRISVGRFLRIGSLQYCTRLYRPRLAPLGTPTARRSLPRRSGAYEWTPVRNSVWPSIHSLSPIYRQSGHICSTRPGCESPPHWRWWGSGGFWQHLGCHWRESRKRRLNEASHRGRGRRRAQRPPGPILAALPYRRERTIKSRRERGS